MLLFQTCFQNSVRKGSKRNPIKKPLLYQTGKNYPRGTYVATITKKKEAKQRFVRHDGCHFFANLCREPNSHLTGF